MLREGPTREWGLRPLKMRGDHSLLRVVPHTLTAAVLTFESRSGAVDHMQATRTELAP